MTSRVGSVPAWPALDHRGRAWEPFQGSHIRRFALTSFVILAASCGGGKGTTAPGLGDGGMTYTPTTSTQQFFDQVIGAECAYYARCGMFSDKSACLDLFASASSASFSSLAYSIDQGRTILNPSAEAACIQAFSNLSCSLKSSGSSAVDDACSSVVVGTIASGGDCINSSECKPGLECDQGSCTASCCLGVCVPTKPLVAIGGSCTGDSACVDTAICNQSYNSATGMSDDTCQARVAIGASCPYYGTCVTNAECVGTYGSMTCVALAKDGAPCASSGVSCENMTSYCDPVKGTCQPRLTEGSPCAIPDAGATAASFGCLGFSQCKNGVCTRLPKVGESCSNPDAAVIDECYMVGKCINGLCQADPPQPVCTLAVAKAAAADAGARD